jgi:hypothetical protein
LGAIFDGERVGSRWVGLDCVYVVRRRCCQYRQIEAVVVVGQVWRE